MYASRTESSSWDERKGQLWIRHWARVDFDFDFSVWGDVKFMECISSNVLTFLTQQHSVSLSRDRPSFHRTFSLDLPAR